MSSVNTESVREEFERIKLEFKNFSSTNKVPKELNLIINSLFAIMKLIMAIFLEKKTKKTSKNSSIPPSQTEGDKSSLSKGSKSQGNKESKETASNMRCKETVTVATVDFCEICGQDLTDETCSHIERRTTIDIVFEKTVTHVDAEVKECPECSSITKGKFPEDMQGPKQYGNGIKSYVINLLVAQMISLNRAQKLVKAMIGEVIAEATMLKFIIRLYLALEIWEKNAKYHLLSSASTIPLN